MNRVLSYDRDFPDSSTKRNLIELPMYNYQYATEGQCTTALSTTTCKVGQYGVAESDPFEAVGTCRQIGQSWIPHCVLRTNRLRTDAMVLRFMDDFKPRNGEITVDYLDFITDICEFNTNSPACKEFIITLYYDKDMQFNEPSKCNVRNSEICKTNKYGEGFTDPWHSNPGCMSWDPNATFSDSYTRCTFKNFMSADHMVGAQTFIDEFRDTNERIKFMFLLQPYCNETKYTGGYPCEREWFMHTLDKKFNSSTECYNWYNLHPSGTCSQNQFDPRYTLNPVYVECDKTEDGYFRQTCLFHAGQDLTDTTAEYINNKFFTGPDRRINELAYKQVMKRYCTKDENKYKKICTFNTHERCVAEPWLTSCGGPGDKCIYDPTILECTDDCKNHPWMTVCGGNGNPCPSEPNTPGCEACKDSPWLEMCGGTGIDPCVSQPGSSACCTVQPTHSSCQSDPCVSSPGSSACCIAQPTHSSCQNDPCVNGPGTSTCCNAQPNHSSCQQNSPCVTAPGSSACCSAQPSHSSCQSVDPCLGAPGSLTCCSAQPNHSSCQAVDPCVSAPGTGTCCALQPNHSSCQSSNPCVTSPGSSACCVAQPTHSSCDESSRIFLILIIFGIGVGAFIIFNK